MDSNEYNKLLNDYQCSSIKICFEKNCGYKLLSFFNKYNTLADLYNYITVYYIHVNNPIHIYLDKECTKEIPYNTKTTISNYIILNNLRGISDMNIPLVYKLYFDLC